jgi:hypothetical protein
MNINLKGFNQSPWIILFKDYYAWFAFTAILYILTNVFYSLDLINANRFNLVDVILTFGFLIFLSMLEVASFALVFVAVHFGIQKYFHVDPAAVFRLLILAWFALSWLNLFLAFFNRSLFR